MNTDIIKIKTETNQGLGNPKQQNKAQCCFLDKIRKNDEAFDWTNKKGARTYKNKATDGKSRRGSWQHRQGIKDL